MRRWRFDLNQQQALTGRASFNQLQFSDRATKSRIQLKAFPISRRGFFILYSFTVHLAQHVVNLSLGWVDCLGAFQKTERLVNLVLGNSLPSQLKIQSDLILIRLFEIASFFVILTELRKAFWQRLVVSNFSPLLPGLDRAFDIA